MFSATHLHSKKKVILTTMKPTAVILTSGLLQSNNAKTAHGLIRGCDRYKIIGVIDDQLSGQDAGEVLDGLHRDIPIFKDIDDAISGLSSKIDHCIIGVATAGGIIPAQMQTDLMYILQKGISIINGLHSYLTDIPDFINTAVAQNVQLIDIRKGKPKSEQRFWSGKIFEVTCPIVAVLGTDCALGKRTTTRLLVESAGEKGINASMVYTGQTGWLQGRGHGFIFDSTVNDFVSGELEHAVHTAFAEDNPDVILIEGQASLVNPSGPCGSEYLVSANAKKVILQHSPVREYFKGWEKLNLKIPPIEKTIELIKNYDAEVVAITLNTAGMDEAAISQANAEYTYRLGIPVLDPLRDDLTPILDLFK